MTVGVTVSSPATGRSRCVKLRIASAMEVPGRAGCRLTTASDGGVESQMKRSCGLHGSFLTQSGETAPRTETSPTNQCCMCRRQGLRSVNWQVTSHTVLDPMSERRDLVMTQTQNLKDPQSLTGATATLTVMVPEFFSVPTSISKVGPWFLLILWKVGAGRCSSKRAA